MTFAFNTANAQEHHCDTNTTTLVCNTGTQQLKKSNIKLLFHPGKQPQGTSPANGKQNEC